MNPDKEKIIYTGTLPKTGGDYVLFLQSADNIGQILTLQDSVFNTLTEEEKPFLLRKDRAFFEKHFDAGNLVLGILHDGQLIAQSIIVNPTAQNPKTGMVDMPLDEKLEKITIIQGVIVHPDYRGNKLMTAMVDAWLAIAEQQGRTNAIAEVAADNYFSWSVFIKEGLDIHSSGVDPVDGTKVFNLHARVRPLIKKRLGASFNESAAQKKKKGLTPKPPKRAA